MKEEQNMKMIQAIREAVGRLLPKGWGSEVAAGMLAGFAAQVTGFGKEAQHGTSLAMG